jgi:RHS repeat-associated protein
MNKIFEIHTTCLPSSGISAQKALATAGQVLAGGERGGKSHISYRPYGEILRTDSYGPDISKFKYTGQEEDKESGLYYYKARYYDPVIGRFAQADSVADIANVQGLNRMMYVNGNPIKYSDPSGNLSANNIAQDFIKALMQKHISETDNPVAQLVLWKMGNKALSRFRNNKGSSFWRSDLGKLANTLNPINIMGMNWAAINYVVGKVLQRDTKLTKVKGGYVVQGGPLMPGGGIAIGQFAVTTNLDESTLRHEAAHLEQYSEWGYPNYVGQLARSPLNNVFQGKTPVAENNADKRAGTFSNYGNSAREIELTIMRIIFHQNQEEVSKWLIQIYILIKVGYVF